MPILTTDLAKPNLYHSCAIVLSRVAVHCFLHVACNVHFHSLNIILHHVTKHHVHDSTSLIVHNCCESSRVHMKSNNIVAHIAMCASVQNSLWCPFHTDSKPLARYVLYLSIRFLTLSTQVRMSNTLTHRSCVLWQFCCNRILLCPRANKDATKRMSDTCFYSSVLLHVVRMGVWHSSFYVDSSCRTLVYTALAATFQLGAHPTLLPHPITPQPCRKQHFLFVRNLDDALPCWRCGSIGGHRTINGQRYIYLRTKCLVNRPVATCEADRNCPPCACALVPICHLAVVWRSRSNMSRASEPAV